MPTSPRRWESKSTACCNMPVKMNSEFAMGTLASIAGLQRDRSSEQEMTMRLSFFKKGAGFNYSNVTHLAPPLCYANLPVATPLNHTPKNICKIPDFLLTLQALGILGKKVPPLHLMMSLMCSGSGLTLGVTWISQPWRGKRQARGTTSKSQQDKVWEGMENLQGHETDIPNKAAGPSQPRPSALTSKSTTESQADVFKPSFNLTERFTPD